MLPQPVSFSKLKQYSKPINSLNEAFYMDIKEYPLDVEFFSLNVRTGMNSYFYKLCQETKFSINFLTLEELKNYNISKNTKTVFIYPEINFTIFNINFDRVQEKEISTPYLVGIKNLRNINCSKTLTTNKFTMAEEPFALFPRVARYYFESIEILTWITQKNISEPHNLNIENSFFEKTTQQSDHNNLASFYDSFSEEKDIFFDHYPMHLFYKKYLDLDLKININEQRLYEF